MEQAALLEPKTNGAVTGRIASRVAGKNFVHRLILEAPALPGYSFHSLTIRHGVSLYPVELLVEVPGASPGSAKDEDAFRDLLGTALRSDGMIGVIQALMAQSRHPESFTAEEDPT